MRRIIVIIDIRKRGRVGFGNTGGEDERNRKNKGRNRGGIRGRREDGGRRKYRRSGKILCECFAVSAPVAVNRERKNRRELTITK
ncbi:MAG: hypothetical protein K2P88_01795 [Chitinophagaceae bacterium]|uniref:hypothetical protein n=1 Tax=unclassified Paraflavitalea TaxID=2798305 RepID=UPI003D334D15|nr:hypothetical protein [Chitinophagaceae bacterium]